MLGRTETCVLWSVEKYSLHCKKVRMKRWRACIDALCRCLVHSRSGIKFSFKWWGIIITVMQEFGNARECFTCCIFHFVLTDGFCREDWGISGRIPSSFYIPNSREIDDDFGHKILIFSWCIVGRKSARWLFLTSLKLKSRALFPQRVLSCLLEPVKPLKISTINFKKL